MHALPCPGPGKNGNLALPWRACSLPRPAQNPTKFSSALPLSKKRLPCASLLSWNHLVALLKTWSRQILFSTNKTKVAILFHSFTPFQKRFYCILGNTIFLSIVCDIWAATKCVKWWLLISWTKSFKITLSSLSPSRLIIISIVVKCRMTTVFVFALSGDHQAWVWVSFSMNADYQQ